MIYFLIAACVLQILLILERALNRILAVVFLASQSDARKITDKNVFIYFCMQGLQIVSVPLEFISALLSVVFKNLILWTTLCVVIGLLSLISQSSGGVFVLIVNVYNSGIGVFINATWSQVVTLYSVFIRPFLPIYNAITWFLGKILLHVIVPSFEIDLQLLPNLAQNMGLFGASIVMSSQTMLSRVVECSQPFENIQGLDCVANTNYMTFDLMTPGLYSREIVQNFNLIFDAGCSPALMPINILLYPFLDYNFYAAFHNLINAALYPISITLQTTQRCSYAWSGETNARIEFTLVEKTVMCVPDFQPWIAICVGGAKYFGKLIDNWLNMCLILIETTLFKDVLTCDQVPGIRSHWNDATHILQKSTSVERPIQVVGLTDTLYAFTDGVSTVYDDNLDGGQKAVSVANWPFPINVNFGVAAVRYNDVFDGDDAGDVRTGMLGCRCEDSDAGINLWCASVGYLQTVNDNETMFNLSSIHQVRFADAGATRYMTCDNTHIKVAPLRFSRKRMSNTRGNGADVLANDYFDTSKLSGITSATSFTADAMIYVSPQCALSSTSRVDCVPDVMTCFPYCVGLHIAAQSGSNITMFPARRWRDSVTMMQTICSLDADTRAKCQIENGDTTSVELYSDVTQLYNLKSCEFYPSQCIEDEYVLSIIPKSKINFTSDNDNNVIPSARRTQQPFVVAGEFLLLEDTEFNNVIVLRLFNHRQNQFSFQREVLSLNEFFTGVTIERSCVVGDYMCYQNALANQKIVLPPAVRLDKQKGVPSAASEWGVHWADNPDDSAMALALGFCQGDVKFGAFVQSSAAQPRVWTLKTTRVQENENAQKVHYMDVPDWLTELTPCDQEVNLKITDLEFLNSNNILVTVLRASPRHYNWQTGFVCTGCHFSYAFYFLHPNLHDCTTPTDNDNAFYSCWRDETAGMWPSRDFVPSGLYGTLCPALQRMPQIGSASAALATASWITIGIILDCFTVLPAAAAGGSVANLFDERLFKTTFHTSLDASGSNLIDIEPALIALDQYAFYVSHAMIKILNLFRGKPGFKIVQPIIVGTAKVQQHMDNFVPLNGEFLSVFQSVKNIPSAKGFSVGASASTDTPSANKPTIIGKLSTLFPSASGVLKYNSRLLKRLARKMLKFQAGTTIDLQNFLTSAIYDSDLDFSQALLSAQRAQCDGFANILGTTNPLARMARHACYLSADAMEGVAKSGKALLLDYAAVDCACRLSAQSVATDVVAQICLRKELPVQWQASYNHFQDLPNSNDQQNLCFALMDQTNFNLEHAFDNFFSRLIRFTSAFESSLDYLLKVIPILGEDAGECANTLQSPYVVSIIPRPIDYFYGCVHTFDCRSRCLDSMASFETALSALEDIPEFVAIENVVTESNFFTFSDVEALNHLAPFEIYAVSELDANSCVNICSNTHAKNRCFVATGKNVAQIVAGYYCIPASYKQSVFLHESLISYSDIPIQYTIDVMFMLTTSQKFSMGFKGELVVALARETAKCQLINDQWEGCTAQIFVMSPTLPNVLLMSTQSFYALSPHLSTSSDQTIFQFIDNVWVKPQTSQHPGRVYVFGRVRTKHGATYDLVQRCIKLILRNEIDSASDVSDVLQRESLCTNAEIEHIFSSQHSATCLSYDGINCDFVAKIPRSQTLNQTLSIYAVNWNSDTWSFRQSIVSEQLAQLISVEKDVNLYRTQANLAVLNQKHLSALTRCDSDLNYLDVLITGRKRDHRGWIGSVRVDLTNLESPKASFHSSTQQTENVEVHVECSIDNCIGCVVENNDRLSAELQAKCFAAAQCAVANCAGTMINLRKPLCNVAKFAAQAVDRYRLAIHSVWIILTRNIIMVVELSKERKELYRIDFFDDVFMSGVCNVKDSVVEAVASVTALIGGIGYIKDVQLPQQNGHFSEVDSKYHSRFVMITTAITGAFTNILLLPLYNLIIMQKTLSCQFNDVFLFIEDSVDIGVKFRIGSSKLQAASDAVVGTCLTKSIEGRLREYGYAEGFKSVQGNLGDILSNAMDLNVKNRLEHFKHVMDGSLTYWLGVLGGVIDVIATSDWYHCRPPSGAQDLSECVCEDEGAVIIDSRRVDSVASSAFWCSGPLMMTNINGDDLLIWNPYSFAELMQVDLTRYLSCVFLAQENCALPTSTIVQEFTEQGVSILQVINRCRSNYNQKTWDFGAIVLGLYNPDVWLNPSQLQDISLLTNDAYEKLHVRMRQLYKHVRPFSISESTWQCLYQAGRINNWNHACAEEYIRFERGFSIDQYFMYARSDNDATFKGRDACQSYTGRISSVGLKNAVLNPSMQTLSAFDSRFVSNTILHHISHSSKANRLDTARERLQNLRTKITSALLQTQEISSADISAQTWSKDGDELHQLIDCVILGPYASADMSSSFTMSNNERLPVSQYYRNAPNSRAFSTTTTKGSMSRQKIVKLILEHVNLQTEQTVVDQANIKLRSLKALLQRESIQDNTLLDYFLCQCPDNTRALTCCMDSNNINSLADITFPALTLLDSWDLSTNIKETMQAQALESDVWKLLWTEFVFQAPQYTDDILREMVEAQVFDTTQTIYNYDQKELRSSYDRTMWQHCTSLLTSSFFTLPLKNGNVDADTTYDPTSETSEEYLHAIERVIKSILSRAQKDSPVYWSHIHRYVASDSVWCESNDVRPKTLKNTVLPEQTFYEQNIQKDTIRHETITDVRMPGSKTCFCGWQTNTDCKTSPSSTNTFCDVYLSDERLKTEWQDLCQRGTYNNSHDFFLIRRVFSSSNETSWMSSCDSISAAIHWGFVANDDLKSWYEGTDGINASLYHLATRGPSGLRFGLLGNGEFSLDNFLQNQKHLEAEIPMDNYRYNHTIAQPVCQDTLSDYLAKNLTQYFSDVFFPMAHSVDVAPAQAACSRWTIEYAILNVVKQHRHTEDDIILTQQRQQTNLWKFRCKTQLQQLGICLLRGVFELTPDGAQSADNCSFSLSSNINEYCTDLFYVTSHCVVMCNHKFYHPCSCATTDCAEYTFNPASASCAPMFDIRNLANFSDNLLDSLHPADILPIAEDPSQTISYLKNNWDLADVNVLDTLVSLVLNESQQSHESEGLPPETFCDDLFDYWDEEAQHPIGYHPTRACLKSDTQMRGFDSWMSVGDSTAWAVDPIRLRNMSAASTTFGSAHLVCSADVYGTNGISLNPYVLSTQWNPQSSADFSIPDVQTYASSSLSDMYKNSENANDNADTPLQQQNPHFYFTLGIIRDWLESDANDLSDDWPSWDTESSSDYGLPLSTIEQAKLHCSLPPLYHCDSDSQCPNALICLKNTAELDGVGICSQQNTCFQHAHCVSPLMCSADGLCVEPVLILKNHENNNIDVQIFAQQQSAACDTDSEGLSEFQQIPSFLRDNGICSYRDWYQFLTNTENAHSASTILPTNNSFHHFTDRASNFLIEAGFLQQNAHACDVDYQHSTFKICTKFAGTIPNTDFAFDATFTASRTRFQNSLQFCNLQGRRRARSGFLNPYVFRATQEEIDTLLYVPETIRDCRDFGICVPTNFYIDGQLVTNLNSEQARQVSVVNTDTSGFPSTFETNIRAYLHSDSQTCNAVGYVVSGQSGVTYCVVDRFTLPLLGVLFGVGEDNIMLPLYSRSSETAVEEKFASLLQHCPRAFDQDVSTFLRYYRVLSRPYYSEDKNAVTKQANNLLLEVFGRQRGFNNINAYEEMKDCAVHLLLRMGEQRNALIEVMPTYLLGNDVHPGLSLYMFRRHALLHVPFIWTWNCVLMAEYDDNGAPSDWLERMTDSSRFDDITCKNFEPVQSSKIFAYKRLQTANVFFTQRPDSANKFVDLRPEILEISKQAANALDMPLIPNIACIELHAAAEQKLQCINDILNRQSIEKCWTKFGRSSQNLFTDAEIESGGDLYTKFETQMLYGQDGLQLGNFESYIANHIVQRQNVLNELVDNDAMFIPSLIFNFLNSAIESIDLKPHNFQENAVKTIVYESTLADYATPKDNSCQEQGLSFVDLPGATKINSPSLQTFNLLDPEYRRYSSGILPTNIQSYLEGVNHEFLNAQADFTEQQALYLMALMFKVFLYQSPHFISESLHNIMEPTPYYGMANDWTQADFQSVLRDARRYDDLIGSRTQPCAENQNVKSSEITNNLYSSLQACVSELQHKIGWQLDSENDGNDKLYLKVDSNLYLNGMYASFQDSSQSSPFLESLLEDIASDTTDVCYMDKYSNRIQGIRPWMATDFDFRSGCDTSLIGNDWTLGLRAIDSACEGVDAENEIVNCNQTFPQYAETTRDYMAPLCKSQHGTLLNRRSVRSEPICQKIPTPILSCSRKKGSLGGYSGFVVSDLTTKQTPPTEHFTGAWSSSNNLIRQTIPLDAGKLAVLQILPTDIAGHSFQFNVRDGQMQIDRMFLSRVASSASLKTKFWLRRIENFWEYQHEILGKNPFFSETTTGDDWMCPFAWIDSLTLSTSEFGIHVPDPRRNSRRFRHITKNHHYVHPAILTAQRVESDFTSILRPGRFMTPSVMCRDPTLQTCKGSNFLINALRELRQDTAQLFEIVGTSDQCNLIFDWPHMTLPLADATSTNPVSPILDQVDTESCFAVDRVPKFGIKYRHQRKNLQPQHQSANSIGGACHMGVLKQLENKASTARIQYCGQENNTHYHCTTTESSLRNKTHFKFTTPSKTPPRKHRHKYRCNLCEDHTQAEFVDVHALRHHLHSSSAQLSVGLPAILSTARMVASAIRNQVCEKASDSPCQEYNEMLQEFSVSPQTFLENLLHNLSVSAGPSTPHNDSLFWNRPWVFCDQNEETLNQPGSCKGSIEKEIWLDAAQRPHVCNLAVSEATSDRSEPISFCNLSPQFTSLCAQIAEWNDEARRIICEANGFEECHDSVFTYVPASYVPANKEFVHETTQNYYNFVSPNTCPAKPIPAVDQQLYEKCSALPFQAFYEIIDAARSIVNRIIELVYFYAKFVSQLLMNLVAVLLQDDGLIQRSAYNLQLAFEMLLFSLKGIIETIADLVFKIVFDYGFGRALLDLVKAICEAITWLYVNIIRNYICTIIQALAGIITIIAEIIGSFPGTDVSGMQDFAKQLFDLPFCHDDDPLNCQALDLLIDNSDLSTAPPSLIVPTRCWSTFITFFGDSQGLSCTEQDFCNTFVGSNEVIRCFECPQGVTGVTSKFGCELSTKTCTCNVIQYTTSSCFSNQDCQSPQSTCRFIDSDLSPSFGNLPCNSCVGQQFCFLEADSTFGFCACALQEIQAATCVELGQNVWPSWESLCYFQPDSSASRSISFEAYHEDLVMTSCMYISFSNSYCTRVLFADGHNILALVSTEQVFASRRRLLNAEETTHSFLNSPAISTYNTLCSDAYRAKDLQETKHACLRAHATSVALIHVAQVDLPACTFCSWDDVFHTAYTHPMQLAKFAYRPRMWLSVVAHDVSFVRRIFKLWDILQYDKRLHKRDHNQSTINGSISVFAYIETPADQIWSFVSSNSGRRLLGIEEETQQFKTDFEKMNIVHRSYAQQFSSAFQYNYPKLQTTETAIWVEDWPPRYTQSDGTSCDLLGKFFDYALRASDSAAAFYLNESTATPTQKIAEAWPTLKSHTASTNQTYFNNNTISSDEDTVIELTVRIIFYVFEFVGVDLQILFDVIYSVLYEIQNNFQCDLYAIQTCSQWKVRLVPAAIIVSFYFGLLFLICQAFGVVFVAVLIAPLFTWMIFYLAYNYSLACIPLIPTCLFEDISLSIQEFLPPVILIPDSLLREGCVQPFSNADSQTSSFTAYNSNCIRSCSEPPFLYTDWQTPVAWAAAEFGVTEQVELFFSNVPFISQQNLQTKLLLKQQQFLSNTETMFAGNRFCAIVTSYKVIPYLTIAYVIILSALASFRILLRVILSFFLLAGHTFVSIFTD